ncbi:MAG: YhcH/YjgK/YiaL family protein [Endomicrobiaceae bacterium]
MYNNAMLISSLKNYRNILRIFPNLICVFDFIKNNISSSVNDGKYEISDGIYAVVQKCGPKAECDRLLETHRKYVDLQYVISGKERIGWKFADKTFKTHKKYSSKNDISFFTNKPDIYINLKKGEFVLLFPEDAHAPLSGAAIVKKCIVKIPKDFLYRD